MGRQQILNAGDRGAELREVFQSLESQGGLERKKQHPSDSQSYQPGCKTAKMWCLGCRT